MLGFPPGVLTLPIQGSTRVPHRAGRSLAGRSSANAAGRAPSKTARATKVAICSGALGTSRRRSAAAAARRRKPFCTCSPLTTYPGAGALIGGSFLQNPIPGNLAAAASRRKPFWTRSPLTTCPGASAFSWLIDPENPEY